MIAVAIFSFLFGAALGQRFRVLALVPAIAAVMVLAVGAGVTHPQAGWWIVKLSVAATICMQCGYFAGIIIRQLLSNQSSKESMGVFKPRPARADSRSA